MAKTKKNFKEVVKYELIGILLIGLSSYIFLSIFNQSTDSYLLPEEKVGILGNFFVRTITSLAGQGKILIPLALLILGIKLIYKKTKVDKIKVFIFCSLMLTILVFLHLRLSIEIVESFTLSFSSGFHGNGGGLIGAILSWVLFIIFGLKGAYLVLVSLWIAGLMYLRGTSIKKFFNTIRSGIGKGLRGLKKQLVDFLFIPVEEEQEVEKEKYDIKKENNIQTEIEEAPLIINHFADKKIEENKKEKDNIDKEKIPISLNTNGKFLLPNISLLEKSNNSTNKINQKSINKNILILQKTLESFGVKGKVVQVSCGPSITRYEFQPAPGVKVSKVVNLADDIALSLASSDVRIEAPIPGKAAIGIEIPNREISTVSLRDVVESEEFNSSSSYLTVALGKDIAGKPIVTRLEKMPHLLIAGATGSGKSVCMNALITSILFKAKPSEVKFIMVDPKMVELTTYNGIPHLISPVVTDPKKAASALRWAVHEMETRYERFAAAGVKDIVRYNELLKESNDAEEIQDNDKFMPYIVVLIDELADLMMIAPADVEDAICRLAQMARAAGIHLVIATQRPSVDVITGIIKANIPSRIAFAVSSQTDSRTILDMSGAEKLLGRGDMLFYPTSLPKPIRLQGVFVSDPEVERIVEFLKKQATPEYVDDIVNQEVLESEKEADEEDELIPEAAKLFLETGQASISSLQRRFRIGYNRAARIVDIMERKGIVGGHEGSKPRKVLITVQDYERLFGK